MEGRDRPPAAARGSTRQEAELRSALSSLYSRPRSRSAIRRTEAFCHSIMSRARRLKLAWWLIRNTGTTAIPWPEASGTVHYEMPAQKWPWSREYTITGRPENGWVSPENQGHSRASE